MKKALLLLNALAILLLLLPQAALAHADAKSNSLDIIALNDIGNCDDFTSFSEIVIANNNDCSNEDEKCKFANNSLATAFITTWQTTTANESITIPINPSITGYNYTLDWGDGNTSTSQTGDATHEYATAGTYTVSITGNFPAIKFGNSTAANAKKLKTIEQWGSQIWQGMDSAFKGCPNLTTESSTDAPVFAANSTLYQMFSDCSSFNSDLNDWDLTNVRETSIMFNGATSFNSAITNWNTANVTNMQNMFFQASAFNGDVSNWNVENVTFMNNMFRDASAFNGDVSNWNVENVTDMFGMFRGATAFNQDIGNWNVGNVIYMDSMFEGVTLSIANYDALLNGWGAQTLQHGVTFGGGNSKYCSGETARNNMTTTFGWNITDGGLKISCSPDALITTWQTTTANESIIIPTNPDKTGYNYTVDWGDGSVSTSQTSDATHQYTTAGTYTVSIIGDFPAIKFGNSTAANAKKLKTIEQWGAQIWEGMDAAFEECSNLTTESSTDAPLFSIDSNLTKMFYNCSNFNSDLNDWDMTQVNNTSEMFRNATSFNGDVENWNVSNVTIMNKMFNGASVFNQNIENWDVSNVSDMSWMFYNSLNFNQNMGSWNVANVANMKGMFAADFPSAFNQDIGNWNVENVITMGSMFAGASAFNQDIGNWNVGSTTAMSYMFYNTTAFNQDIGSWNVGNVTGMASMFYGASQFNQDIGNWDVGNVTAMNGMLTGANLSIANYDAILIGWGTDSSGVAGDGVDDIPNTIPFGAGTNQYCAGETKRQELTDTYGWTITDGGLNCSMDPTSAFITTWQTTTANESITIPTNPNVSGYNYTVDWGDGNTSPAQTADATHEYATAGTYTVSIMGDFPAIQFGSANSDDTNDQKLLTIEQWGTGTWHSMNKAFRGCSNLQGNYTDAPNLNSVTDMSLMFRDASVFNSGVSNWNVANVTEMSGMFSYALAFNQDIGNWNVGKVTNMSFMFQNASTFNQDIGNWNVESVTDMSSMFQNAFTFNQDIASWNVANVNNMEYMFSWAYAFNKDIGSWNVAKVANMSAMFVDAIVFNQNIGSWNVSSVMNMSFMFQSASSFNQDIGNWKVGSVTDMYYMFSGASAFNQNIGSWNVSNVLDMDGMFYNATLSTANYDALLNGWSAQTLKPNINFHAGNSKYCATAARDILTNAPNNWTITDGGLDPNCVSTTDYFITTWKTTTTNESITIPINPNVSGYSYNVDWGDSNTSTAQTTDATHEYVTAGTYTVSITGDFPAIQFGSTNSDDTNDQKLLTIEQWGTQIWQGMDAAFKGCSNLTSESTTDAPIFTTNSTLYGMFAGCSNFNSDLNDWDLSNVRETGYMFGEATSFNGAITNWNTANVTNMQHMFLNAAVFNKEISGWNVSSVILMNAMFKGASAFNSEVSNWNVENVTDMSHMFKDASAFNGDVSNWNVENVTNMSYMFWGATAFNRNVSNWNVENVTNMYGMFLNASSFNGDVSNWNVENVTDMTYMFFGLTLSTANYDALLNGWSAQTLKPNVNFDAGNSKYCAGEAAHNTMINTYGWAIADGGRDPGCTFCPATTTFTTVDGWDNGVPTNSKKAIFADDYNTTLGSIDACSIEINPGVTVTVSEGKTIKAVNDITINGNLIFLSTANGDGQLGIMGATSNITGNATVQRYMSDNRSYRMVSPAVTTTTSINANWQEGVHNIGTGSGNNQNPHPTFGTHITGSKTGADGLDATATGNASMYTVDVANQVFEAVLNTNSPNNLTAGNPYLLFVRGDRGIDLGSNSASSPTVLRATGELVTGDQTQDFPTALAGNFVMFGNPYQSTVDIESVFGNSGSNNLNLQFYYVYDPTLPDHGAYVIVDYTDGPNGSNSNASSTANKYLQPGQAAQVQVTGPAAVTFTEADKAPGNFTATNRNPMSENNILAVQLYTTENFNNGKSSHDGFMMFFAEGNDNGLTRGDAIKAMNFYENLGINHEGTYLGIERRDMPQPAEVYPLYSNGYTHSDYTLKLTVDGLEDTFLYLQDHFTGTSTLLETGENSYDFNVDASNPLSKATDRFSIRTEERLGVNDNDLLAGIHLYPNPLNADVFYINAPRLNGEQLIVTINDLSGRSIFEQNLECNANTVTVPMGSDIASGVYMVTLKHGGEAHTYRLIKE